MPTFQIPVKQYNSTPRHPGTPVNLPSCVVNDRQLTVGIVRSILTHNPSRIARRFTAAIVRPTLLFILDWGRPPDLSWNPRVHGVLRDFSVTTRVGELAQGVAYCYWQLHGGYPQIADFASLAPHHGIAIPVGAKVPDYLMHNPITGVLALMEAKGTRSADHTQSMAAALRQCRSAQAYTPAMQSYGCVLTLDAPTGSGTLHLRDPEKLTRVSNALKHDVFRQSYASWFDMLGDEEAATWCRTPIQARKRLDATTPALLSGEQSNFKDPLRQIVSEALGFDPKRTRFVLDDEIEAALTDIGTYKRLNWSRFKSLPLRSSDDPGAPLKFPDGTSILPD